MRTSFASSLALACLGLSAASLGNSAAAEPVHRKPGLWQVTAQMNMVGAPEVSPDELAQLQKMGISMPKPHTMSTQICETQASLDSAQAMNFGPSKDCKAAPLAYQGNDYTGSINCDGPDLKGTGTIKGSVQDAENYSGSMHFTGTSAAAGPVDMTTDFSGKWLAASCPSRP